MSNRDDGGGVSGEDGLASGASGGGLGSGVAARALWAMVILNALVFAGASVAVWRMLVLRRRLRQAQAGTAAKVETTAEGASGSR